MPHDKIESRRAFMKKLSNLGAAAFAASFMTITDNEADAFFTEDSPQKNGCDNSCTKTCGYNCVSGCRMFCRMMCQDYCNNTCSRLCYSSCGGSCNRGAAY